MAGGLQSASLIENARFNALVVVPNALQGLFRKRRTAVGVATRADVDRWAIGLLKGMKRGHAGGPVWVRVVRDRALLLLTPQDVHRALEGSPEPFAADPPGKRNGMCAFQPDALTISRDGLWANRRRFAEAVLDTGSDAHRLAGRFAEVCAEEVDALIDSIAAEKETVLDYDAWHAAFRHLTRRVVLGDAARDDEELSEQLAELMAEGNSMPGEPSEKLPAFIAHLQRYVDAAEPGSLAALVAGAPHDEDTRVTGQLVHWLFATQDTLAANLLRALALLASHPNQLGRVEDELAALGPGPLGAVDVAGLDYLEGCLEEAMRLWPTTPMLSRETTADVDWLGVNVPAGTQVLFVNTFLHRDSDRIEYADRFEPEAWTEGDAGQEWSFNHFSRGPQGCPGAGLALFLGKAMIAELLRGHEPTLRSPKLDPARKLPYMLDYFGIELTLV